MLWPNGLCSFNCSFSIMLFPALPRLELAWYFYVNGRSSVTKRCWDSNPEQLGLRHKPDLCALNLMGHLAIFVTIAFDFNFPHEQKNLFEPLGEESSLSILLFFPSSALFLSSFFFLSFSSLSLSFFLSLSLFLSSFFQELPLPFKSRWRSSDFSRGRTTKKI